MPREAQSGDCLYMEKIFALRHTSSRHCHEGKTPFLTSSQVRFLHCVKSGLEGTQVFPIVAFRADRFLAHHMLIWSNLKVLKNFSERAGVERAPVAVGCVSALELPSCLSRRSHEQSQSIHPYTSFLTGHLYQQSFPTSFSPR